MTDLEIIEQALMIASGKGCFNSLEAEAINAALKRLKEIDKVVKDVKQD